MSRKLFPLISVVLIAASVLSACAPAAAPTAAPQPTPAPAQPTQAPAQPTQPPKPTEAPKPTAIPQPTAAPKVKIAWWHITTKDPGLSLWKKLADEYTKAHPNVTIEITVLENEAFKTKLTTVLQSGNPPDIFQSWGGGDMNQQVTAGLLKDITPDLDANGGAWRNTFAPGALAVYSYQGKNYGVPWDMGMVGWW